MSLNNPSPERLRAAALAYDPLTDQSPKLVAKGTGALAELILKRANEQKIPVHQDAGLISFLMKLDFDQQIPAELYVAVAHVLAMLWAMEQKNEKPPAPPV